MNLKLHIGYTRGYRRTRKNTGSTLNQSMVRSLDEHYPVLLVRVPHGTGKNLQLIIAPLRFYFCSPSRSPQGEGVMTDLYLI